MKYYFFRDLEHDDNFKDDTSYHSAGLVERFENTIENANGLKDISVTFFDSFDGCVISAWRTYSEVELFEVDEWRWKMLKETLDVLNAPYNGSHSYAVVAFNTAQN